MKDFVTVTENYTDRQTDRQTDRHIQTDRQTDRQTQQIIIAHRQRRAIHCVYSVQQNWIPVSSCWEDVMPVWIDKGITLDFL